MALYQPYGDDSSSSVSTFWTPGLVIAALAIGYIVLVKGSEHHARRKAHRTTVNRARIRAHQRRR